MTDEEKTAPLPGEEHAGAVHWAGPTDRKRPRALGLPEEEILPAGTAPVNEGTVPVPETAPEEEASGAGGSMGEAHSEETPPALGETPAHESAAKPAPAKKPAEKKPAKRAGPKKKKPVKRKIEPAPPRKKREEKTGDPDPWEAERDYRPIRTRRDGRIGCLGGLMYAMFIISLSIVLAVFLWMSASDVLALNKPEGTVEVTLPAEIFSNRVVDVTDEDGNVTGTKTVRAADINSVSAILKDAGLINYKWLFRLYSGFSHADLKVDPGTYALATNLDYRALVTKMRAGADSQLQTLVMFPEGFNMDQIFARLEENGVCAAEDLYRAAADTEFSYAFLEGVETGDPNRLEGFLFPETYEVYLGATPKQIVQRMLDQFDEVFTPLWEAASEAQGTELVNGLTIPELVAAASLIERESKVAEDRPLIASVIYNRIAAGMPLGIDSTILYVHPDYTGGVDLPAEYLTEESPYNTRLNTGLPPTPICNPGMASIQAALNPIQTDYYYYALDAQEGVHKFFNDYNSFSAFVAEQNYEQP